MWRVISVGVEEDDLDSVPMLAGTLWTFYEKLGQLHLLKYRMALPRTTVSGSVSSLLLASSSYFMFPAY